MSVSPIYGYTKRTGVTKLRTLILALCRLFQHFQPTITAWIDAQMSPDDANTVKAWLGALDAICIIIGATPDD